jgi:predicted transposase YbfD/YdcC
MKFMSKNRTFRENRQFAQKQFDIIKEENSPASIQEIATNFLNLAEHVEDPRTRDCPYVLPEILFVAAIAYLCGAESDEDVATFGRSQINWFRQFIPLKNGIPSHDTFRRVFELLKPEALNELYKELFQALSVKKRSKQIAIDGKVSRGCYETKGQSLLNTVSAYDTDHGISLAQVSTNNNEGKDVGEFNAIPKLIEQLDITGSVVTIDAGGCYAEIVNAIIDGNGNYVITLKENQPTLYKVAESIFEQHEQNNFEGIASYHTSDSDHGRIEERTYYAIPIPTDDERLKKWTALASFVMCRSLRTVKGKETTESIRYYISNLLSSEVVRLGQSVRSHWGVENNLHWVLDVSFGEDDNRTRVGNGAENKSILRRLALGILSQVKGKKTIPNVKFRLAVDPKHRTEVIKKFFMR